MRIKLISILLFVSLVSQGASGGSADSVRIKAYLPVERADPAQWITRYQKAIDNFIDENRALEDRSCDVLFVGTSQIRRWNSIDEDMAPMKVIRRAYGGGSIRDMIYNYNVIARGYDPKAFVMAVGNDLANSANDLTVGDLYDLYRVFINMVRKEYPETPFVILALPPSPKQAPFLPTRRMMNYLLKEYAENTPYVHFVDVASPMFDEEGNLQDLFVEDNVHLNEAGYAKWTQVLRPVLLGLTGY